MQTHGAMVHKVYLFPLPAPNARPFEGTPYNFTAWITCALLGTHLSYKNTLDQGLHQTGVCELTSLASGDLPEVYCPWIKVTGTL